MTDDLTTEPTRYPSEYLLNTAMDDGDEDRYWGLSDRDVPILIGAAAGQQLLSFPSLEDLCVYACPLVCMSMLTEPHWSTMRVVLMCTCMLISESTVTVSRGNRSDLPDSRSHRHLVLLSIRLQK